MVQGSYRLWDPKQNIVLLTREVIFDEDKMIGDESSGSYPAIDELIVDDQLNSDEIIENAEANIVNTQNESGDEPNTYKEAIYSQDSKVWQAMQEDGRLDRY